jgi:hypothetical protein
MPLSGYFVMVVLGPTIHEFVWRARPPSKLIMIVTATIAVGLLGSTCMSVWVREAGPSDRLPGDFARDPDERP